MSPSELPDEALNLIHTGAGPICPSSREAYYGIVAEGIRNWQLPTLSNRMILDLVQAAQRRLA
jgi:hypothetical protein